MGFGRLRFRRSFGQVKAQFRGARPKFYPLFTGLLDTYAGASAAYSLRRLSKIASSVVRVRRASDNAEKDFTADDITDSSMVNWVNGQIVPPLDIRELDSNGERTGALVEAAAAYSLRNLSASYTGNVVDVRRSSDDAEDSFTAAEVADGTLVTWVGAGNDGFVSQWYDQSGNANHATQGTDASQPKIVDAGSLVSGGLDFDGVDDFFDAPFPLDGATAHTSIVVASPTKASRILSIKEDGRADENWRMFISGSNNTGYGLDDGTAYAAQTAITLGNRALVFGSYDASDLKISLNGGTPVTSSVSGFTLNTTGDLEIGRNAYSGGNAFGGKIEELIIYNSDQSDNRTAIEANIGETYNIDLPSGVDTGYDQVDGFVETWYDQSGNGNDAVQQVSGSQPKIVDAGVLVSGGLDFDGVDDHLNLTGSGLDIFKNVGYGQIFTVVTPNRTTTGSNRYFEATTATTGARVLLGDSQDYASSSRIGGRRLDSDSFQDIESSTSHGNNETLVTAFLDWADSDAYLYFNGTQVASSTSFQTDGNTSDTSSNAMAIGGESLVGDFEMQELIIYNSDQSSNRAAIETNINNQYDIY